MLYWFLGIIFVVILIGSIATLIILHERLKRSGFVIESFLGSTINGKIIFDAKGRFYAANKSAVRTMPLLQNSDTPPVLQNVFDYMYDNAVDIDANLRNAIVSSTNDLNEDDENFREVIQLPTGRLFLMIAQKSNQNFTLLIMIDISRQWRQEAIFTLLGEKNNQLMLAIEASNIGVIISMPKREGNPVSFANAAVTQMTGIPKERLNNGYWHQLCDVFTEDNLADKLSEAFDQQMPTEIPLTRSGEDGRLHWFSLAITPVFDEVGGVDLFIGVLKDTTEFKVREAEFFQAQKLEALGQLSAGIAHDFNNILSIIDGYTRLAAKQVDKDNIICADYLERVCIATQRGAALTKRMLTFSRHKIIAEKTCELGQVIRDQEILLGAVIDPSIKLQVEVLAENIYVQCAPDTIAQIMMNLVINSRDAIGAESGVIEVCAERVLRGDLTPETLCKLGSAKSYAMLSIVDSGCGIPSDIQHKIFDPFFTTKSAEKGTGLGMSVVYGLVKDMKGCIEIQSGSQTGAIIRIYIPLSKEAPAIEPPVVSNGGGTCLQSYTAMVVDDEPDILEITASMLRGAGMKVLEAIDGNDALDRQEDYEGEIHILVTDILMPELNGVKLAELFKSLRPETQVLFMSGYPSGRDYEYIQVPQSTPFLAKPVEYNKLIVLIEALLGVRKVPHQDNIAAMGDNLDHWLTDIQAKKLKN